jgi:long-chain acyl-CoA synthetase
VVPNFERLETWAADHGVPAQDRAVLCRDAVVRELLERETLGRLTDLAQFERPKKIAVLLDELTVEGGLLTPTFKVKRRLVEQRFKETIEALYGAG